VPDRDAGGPEHRPDRLALELRRGLGARLRHHARTGWSGRRRHDKIVHLDANQEEEKVIAQANAEIDPKTGKLKASDQSPCRSPATASRSLV
jgi:hypothetical protein